MSENPTQRLTEEPVTGINNSKNIKVNDQQLEVGVVNSQPYSENHLPELRVARNRDQV